MVKTTRPVSVNPRISASLELKKTIGPLPDARHLDGFWGGTSVRERRAQFLLTNEACPARCHGPPWRRVTHGCQSVPALETLKSPELKRQWLAVRETCGSVLPHPLRHLGLAHNPAGSDRA